MLKKAVVCIMAVLCMAVSSFAKSENDDLIHYFSFANNTVDLISLESPTTVGTVSYVTSESGCGKALKLDGNSYLEFDLAGLEEWVISFWLKIDELPTKGMHLVGKKADIFEGDTGNYNFVSGVSTTGQLNAQYETRGSNTDYKVSYSPIAVNTWYHVIEVRKTDGTHSLYINGSLATSTVQTATPCSNNMPLLIGGKIVENAVNLKGCIDEVRIYDVGKDDAQFISDVYTATEGLACNPTIVEVEKEVVVEVPVETIVYQDREVVVEKIVEKEVIVEKIVEVPITVSFSERTDSQLTNDFFSILIENADRKKNPKGKNYDGDLKNDVKTDNGNHYGNDTADNNTNDVNNTHNEAE